MRVAPDLERRIEARAELDEAVIEVGHARLERVRHRRAVDLGQEVVRQPQPGVDVQQAVEIRRRLRPRRTRRRRARRHRARSRSRARKRGVKRLAMQQHVEHVGDRAIAALERLGDRAQQAVLAPRRRQPLHHRGQRRRRVREPARQALLAHALAIVRVAAEDFVGALAGQHDGDVAAREARRAASSAARPGRRTARRTRRSSGRTRRARDRATA